MHTNNFKILFALSFTVFINTFSFAQDIKQRDSIKPLVSDVVIVKTDSIITPEISEKVKDSTLTDSIKPKKELLGNIIDYHATDYIKFNRKKNTSHLYNEAVIDNGEMNIKAGSIIINNNTNTVYAKGIIDSTGSYIQKPIFTPETGSAIEPDSIVFNTETKKALIYNSRTQQGEGHVIASITKKENDSVYFLKDGKYTTAENLDDPEYYIKLRKAKVVPGKKIITGLANLFIYDVPTPLGLPFGFFPQSEKQTSGIIIPTFGEDNNRGFFLQNFGYYFAVSDYFDFTLFGDYYTNGSYGTRLESAYKVRYKYSGNFSFRYENALTSERGFSDYAQNVIYNLRWTHTQDQKSNPNSRFSASVNLGSSTYYQNSTNQVNLANRLNNTLQSSVSYSKTFQGEPQVNLSLTASHQQNSNTEVIDMTLPTLQGSISRIYPFEPKIGSKKGILQNINLQYNLRGENQIKTTDSLFFKKGMFDDAKIGAQHTIPLTTNFKLFKYLSLSAGTNFNEIWTLKTIEEDYDAEENEVVIDTINGFDSFRTYNFSTSLGTTLYGTFNFEKDGKDPKIQAIRHVVRPSLSYNINPAFDKYYDSYEVIDADNTTTSEEYTRFQGSIFGAPNKTFSSSMGISLSNNLEAKVRDKDTTATESKKVILLNNLNFSTSYNFAGDSLQWSPVRVSGGTQLFNNKMSINFGATLDPYALDNNNTRVDTYNIDNGGSLFRLTSANLTTSWSISSTDGDNKKNNKDKNFDENLRGGGRDDDLFGVSQDFSTREEKDEDDNDEDTPNEFYRFKIPWSLRLAYTVNYGNSTRQNEISSHSLMFSGDIDLTDNWSVGASSGYDFKNKGFSSTQLRFERDLLSWRMNFSWVPFGTYTSWNFFIGISSSILKDLKYEKRRRPDITL